MKKLTALTLAITMLLTLLTGNISAVENEFVFGGGYSDYYWNSEFNLSVGEDDSGLDEPEITPMVAAQLEIFNDSIAVINGIMSGQCGDSAYWTFDESTGTLTVYGTGDMWDDTLFYGFGGILPEVTNLIIENGIRKIGDNSFRNANITSIEFPESVEKIGEKSFYDCSLSGELVIPRNVSYIGSSAFDSNKLISVVFMCDDCDIRCHAFGWNDISNVVFPKHLTRFDGFDHNKLTELNLTESVKIFGCGAIEGMDGLTHIEFPESLTTFEYKALYGCWDYTEDLIIPSSVTEIGDRAIFCGENQKIYFEGNAPSVSEKWLHEAGTEHGSFRWTDTLYYKPGTTGWTDSPAYDSATGTWNGYNLRVWGDESQFYGQCGDNAFWNFDPATGVLNITGSGSIWKDINWKYPWTGLKDSITTVNFEPGITNVPERAFEYCIGLQNVSLSNMMTFIGDRAFYGCALSGKLTIPSRVAEIQSGAFGMNHLTAVDLPVGLTYFTGFDHNDITEIIIPEGVTEVKAWAMRGNAKLTHVEFPSTLVEIGYDSFDDCSSLPEVIIPTSVKEIKHEAFWDSPNQKIYFEGNAPAMYEGGSEYPITFDSTDTLYYKPGTTGWTDSPDYDPATGKWKGYTIKPWESGDPGKVTALYPANGTVDFGYDNQNYYKVGFETMSVTFDKVLLAGDKTGFNYETYAPLDFSKGNISIYRADGKLIWEASPTSFSQCAGDVKILSDGMTLEITPSNKYMLFDYDTEYYVVIDPSVVKFDNGTTFTGIKKGEWAFTTVEEKLDHEHKSDGWESDDTSHWHTCEICGRKYDIEEHQRDDNCKCTVCGKTAHMPATIVVDAKEPTCISDGYTGDRYCLLCHKVVEQGEAIAALGHDPHWVAEDGSQYHWQKCSRCFSLLTMEDHTYNDKGKCTVCGANDPSYLQNPEGFVQTAWKYLGYNGKEMHDYFGVPTGKLKNGTWRSVAWCNQFVYYIAKECNLTSAIKSANMIDMQKFGVTISKDDGRPQPGDLVFFDWGNNGDINHVGIVSEVNGNKFAVIHGNYHASTIEYGLNGWGVVCGPTNKSKGWSCVKHHDVPYSGMNSNAYWDVNDDEVEKFVRIDWNNIQNSKGTNTVINLKGDVGFAIEWNDEVLSSNETNLMVLDIEPANTASFGYYVVKDDGSYEITLDYHTGYKFTMYALDNGSIDLDIKYYDFDSNLLNSVAFRDVAITDTTTIETSPFNEFGGYELYLLDSEEDDIIGWSADKDETVTTPNAEFTEYLNYGEENQPDGEEPTAQPVLPTHNHAFTSWQYDSFYHWRSCVGCGLRTDVYQHEFVDDVCTVCGYTRETSEEPETVPDDDGTVEVEVPTEGKKVIEEVSGAITDSKRKG